MAVVQAEPPADQRADVTAYPACERELRGILAGISEEGARVRVLLTADAGDGDSAYLLLVGFTESAVYRAYAVPHDRGDTGRAAAATRTSGRRVGVWLKLLRPRDRATVWLAEGSGEMWETRTAAAPGASPAAANVDDDLGSGNLPLYPDPPPADVVSQRLTRRLLAQLPIDVEPEPN